MQLLVIRILELGLALPCGNRATISFQGQCFHQSGHASAGSATPSSSSAYSAGVDRGMSTTPRPSSVGVMTVRASAGGASASPRSSSSAAPRPTRTVGSSANKNTQAHKLTPTRPQLLHRLGRSLQVILKQKTASRRSHGAHQRMRSTQTFHTNLQQML